MTRLVPSLFLAAGLSAYALTAWSADTAPAASSSAAPAAATAAPAEVSAPSAATANAPAMATAAAPAAATQAAEAATSTPAPATSAAPEAPAATPDQTVTTVPAPAPVYTGTLPQRGMNMDNVEHIFGAPVQKYDAVGKPPITRWDYPDYVVYFEYNMVVHTVMKADAFTRTSGG